MTLRDVLVSPPIWFDDQANTVTITWSLPSAQAWWEMTWKGRPDPTLDRGGTASPNWSTSGTHTLAAAAATTSTVSAMFSVTRLLDVAEADRDRVLGCARAVAAAPRARHWHRRADAAGCPQRRRHPGAPALRRRANGGPCRRISTAVLSDPADHPRQRRRLFGSPLRNGAAHRHRVSRAVAARGPRHRRPHHRSLRGRPPLDAALCVHHHRMATEPRRRGGRDFTVDACVRAGVHRPRRTDGPLPDAPDPLGCRRSLVRPRMPRSHCSRSRVPQFLLHCK